MRLRILAVITLVLATAAFTLAVAAPAEAATKHAGIPNLTPYGGYLGNYLAPDGARVYCIDSALEWPSGSTSAPSSIDSLVTSWGSALSTTQMQKLNYVLLQYGQTDDAVQAAAVAAFVNAYTSGWARDLGAGYAAGAWYLNGNEAVTGVYDTIWADAEANAIPVGEATLLIDAIAGTVSVTATPSHAVGTLTLSGALRADTGEASSAITAAEVIPFLGQPADESREFTVAAHATFTAATPAAANLLLYTTGDQQRTIRGGTPGVLEFTAAATSEALPVDFEPVLTTVVDTADVRVGQPMIDRVSVALADGSRPWRIRTDGTPVAITADGVLYGPFESKPSQSDTVPIDAPVAATQTLTFAGPGEYLTSDSVLAEQPGFYTWVWSIDAARQDPVGTASLPEGYSFRSPFGIPDETHSAHSQPVLAATGSAPQDAGLVGAALVGVGALMVATRAGAVKWRGRLGISRPSERWHSHE